jgi:hypothetical protein
MSKLSDNFKRKEEGDLLKFQELTNSVTNQVDKIKNWIGYMNQFLNLSSILDISDEKDR